MKYRLIITLLICCGVFLIASIANTVKKQMNSNTKVQEFKRETYNSTQSSKIKSTDSVTRNVPDTLWMNGKDWRTRNELHIMY